jgi:formamidopyrimidine-DNA glycosylase
VDVWSQDSGYVSCASGRKARRLRAPGAKVYVARRVPELPEVEVTRRELEPRLIGRTIATVRTTAPSYFFITSPRSLRRRLCGRRAQALSRAGKYLILELDDGSRLLLHLGMTGQLFFAGESSLRLLSTLRGVTLTPEQQRARGAGAAPRAEAGFVPDAHTHLVLGFDDAGPSLLFRDVRKFGKVELLLRDATSRRLSKLGVDALQAEGRDLHAAASGRIIPVKSLLLDQAVLAGVGNIYADEALFLAGVHPRRRSRRLTALDCDRLVAAVQQVMLRSIETGGSSISDYVRPSGERGSYQDERRVYGRTGLPCGQCGTPIQRCVLGQRSTHFCPSCQAK